MKLNGRERIVIGLQRQLAGGAVHGDFAGANLPLQLVLVAVRQRGGNYRFMGDERNLIVGGIL